MFHKLFVMEFMAREKAREMEEYVQQQQLLQAAQEDPAYYRPYYQWVLSSIGERLIALGTSLNARNRPKSNLLPAGASRQIPCPDPTNTFDRAL